MAAGWGLKLRLAVLAGPIALVQCVLCWILMLPAIGAGDPAAGALAGGAGAAFLLSRTMRARVPLATLGAALLLAALLLPLGPLGGSGSLSFVLPFGASGVLVAALVALTGEPAALRRPAGSVGEAP